MTTFTRAGIAEGLPTKELDRQASVLLRVDVRTARRYRRGEVGIPGPVTALLGLMGASPSALPAQRSNSTPTAQTRPPGRRGQGG